MWRFAPFYLALAAAPLLFGGVKPESQATLGILFAIALWTTRPFSNASVLPRWLKIAALIWVALSLIPLPFALVKILDPERARLAAEFPIDLQTPSWITLSISPARTVQRLFELALGISAFILARRSASVPGSNRRFALTIAIALILLGLSDVWSREHGRESILGLWKISWGKGSGTFANHNHFANWIYVASVFCAGWILNELFRRDRKPNRAAIAVVAGAATFGLVMAFLAASRSGSLAFVAGAIAFLLLMRGQLQHRSFALAASLLVIAGIVVALIAAEPLLHRVQSISTASSVAGKLEIWRDSARIAGHFPIFGAGAGGFVRVFNFYKSAHGDGTFWHAENDWHELSIEYGIPGALLILTALYFLVRTVFKKTPFAAGIVAALVVFAVHCCGEFISHIPANLILAAALLGLGIPATTSPRSMTSLFAPGALLAASVLQLGAWFYSWEAARSPQPLANIQRSLGLWPFAVNHHIGELRAATKVSPAPLLDDRIDRALQLDPLNWELRVEQSWYQFAYATNQQRAMSNAWLAVRLNPMQGQIPLRYARHFAAGDPDLALRFLAAVDPGVPANHEAALAVAWNITHEPAELWKLTPNSVPALHNLIHFALGQKLYPIAAQACQSLEGRIEPQTLAQYYFDAHRPADAMRLVQNLTTRPAQSLRIQALAQLGRFTEAIEAAQQYLAVRKDIIESPSQAGSPFELLLTNHIQHPNDPAAALLLAEKTATLSPPNLLLLSNLSVAFPSEPRIAYLLLQSQVGSGQTNAAAQTAAGLVSRVP